MFEWEKQGDNIRPRIPSTTAAKTLDGAIVDLVEDAQISTIAGLFSSNKTKFLDASQISIVFDCW